MNKPKKINIRDIAKLAGVSPATISLVINRKPGVNEATRNKVLGIVKQHNYVPRFAAQGEPQKRLRNIAVILPRNLSEISELFHIELNKSIIDACEKQSYNAVFTSLREINGALTLPDVIQARDVDGIILLGDTDEYTYAMLNGTGLPIVMLDSSIYRPDWLSVYIDYKQAAYTATHFLLELGHRDIAFIGNEEQHHFNLNVFSGFQEAMQEKALNLKLSRIQMNVYDEHTLFSAMDILFEAQPVPTALFCATDLHAIYALNYLADIGIKVPLEVSIIGLDDLILSKFVTPSLTTVRVNRVETGKLGVDLLLRKIRIEDVSCIKLPSSELIIRNTTAAPRANPFLDD